MQAQINVKIRAIDPDNKTYQLIESDLKSLKLIDYGTKQELTGNWTYSTEQKEEFVHIMPHETPGAPVTPIADGSQTVVLWISSKQLGDRRIAAQITQPGGTQPTVTTTSGSFDSSITILASQPITYTMSDVTVTQEDTAEGFWEKEVQSGVDWNTRTYAWDQDNYYVKSERYPFVKVDRQNVDVEGTQKPYASPYSSLFRDAFAYMGLGNDRDVSMFFMPQMGGSSKSRRGLTAMNDYNIIRSSAYVEVNQRPNQLCLTRLLFGNGWVPWYPNWQEDTWFTIYDQYGNYGHFSVKTNASNTISISTRYVNTQLSAEPKAIEPAAKL